MFVSCSVDSITRVELKSVPCLLTRPGGVYSLHSADDVLPQHAAHTRTHLHTLVTHQQVSEIDSSSPVHSPRIKNHPTLVQLCRMICPTLIHTI